VQEAALHASGDDDDLARDMTRDLVRGKNDDLVARSSTEGSSRVERVMGETVQPGQTAFTRARGATRTTSFLRLRRRPPIVADLAAA
jgi:hypothetical protein